MWLVLSIVGPLVLVTVILVIVFATLRRAIDRAAAALAPEGIELDSGHVIVTMRARGAYRRNSARVILTKQRLYILQRPQRLPPVERADLAKVAVSEVDGALCLRGASVDLRIPVRDREAWIRALATG